MISPFGQNPRHYWVDTGFWPLIDCEQVRNACPWLLRGLLVLERTSVNTDFFS